MTAIELAVIGLFHARNRVDGIDPDCDPERLDALDLRERHERPRAA
jgi:hypothetical protein